MTLGALTLDDLTTPDDSDAVETYLLTNLAALEFPVTAWENGDVALTLVKVEALALSDLIGLVAAIAAGGLLERAAGGWLTLLARSVYGLERDAPASATGTVRVSVASGFSSQSIAQGQLWVSDAAGHRFNSTNASTVVIAAGAYADIEFRAESDGAEFNIGSGTAIELVTPLPGTTVALLASGGAWLTVQGTAGEADSALKARCRGRWATIGLEKTRDGYAALARSAPGVSTRATRVYVDDASPRGAGTADVWISGPSGPLSGGDVTLISDYVLERKSLTADVEVDNAVAVPIDVTAVIHRTASNPDALADATALVTDLINGADIGGAVRRNGVIEALMTPSGVYDVAITVPAANVSLAANEVATVGTLTLTEVVT